VLLAAPSGHRPLTLDNFERTEDAKVRGRLLS